MSDFRQLEAEVFVVPAFERQIARIEKLSLEGGHFAYPDLCRG